jgi:hypothetical protein
MQVKGVSLPAPTGGWDAQKPLANMPAQNAVFLQNWIPRLGYIEARKGHAAHVTGFSDPVETLIVWRGAGSQKMLAASSASIKNVTSAGSAGAASTLYASAQSAKWQYTNFANDAGQFCIMVNGLDAPKKFNGSAITTTVITASGLTATNLSEVMQHKRRLLFIEKNTLHIWFLDIEAIAGTAQLLDLGPVFQKGGKLACMGTWSVDGGQGTDDFAVFMTDQGEVAVYQGTDPSDANNWALVGVFALGLPLGQRAILKYGSDLAILTTDGIVPMSQALNLDRSQDNQVALTAKIQNAFFNAATLYKANFGWQGMLYQKGAIAIFNIPISTLEFEQYVQSVQGGGWCRFTGMASRCWAVFNDNAYFGGKTGVYKFDTTSSDNGSPITFDSMTAFNYFGTRGQQKKFEMMRPIMSTSQPVMQSIAMATDFNLNAPITSPETTEAATAVWDISVWDTGQWGGDQITQYPWNGAQAIGYCGAARTKIVLNSLSPIDIKLIGYDLTFQSGGIL